MLYTLAKLILYHNFPEFLLCKSQVAKWLEQACQCQEMNSTVMIWRSGVQTPVGSNFECIPEFSLHNPRGTIQKINVIR